MLRSVSLYFGLALVCLLGSLHAEEPIVPAGAKVEKLFDQVYGTQDYNPSF